MVERADTGGGRAGERIDHVVVLMLENRSFDQMLGGLPGVDGVPSDGGTNTSFVNYLDPQHPDPDEAFPVSRAQYFGVPDGDIPPPAQMNGVATELYGGPSHSFPSANQQLCNDQRGPAGEGAQGTTPATNSGFVKSYSDELKRTYASWARADPAFVAPDEPTRAHLEIAMAAYSPDQLPVLNGLASAFCVCDRWFSEVPGPTEPNRLFMHAATSVGFVHNPWAYPVPARTIYEDIDEVGNRTWATYYYDLADAVNFPALKSQTDKLRLFDQFFADVNRPDFPSYVFLCPRYMNAEDGFANSQHAPWDVRFGEHWVADVYEAIRNSPIWERTLLVITYDEHGGFHDHVSPPDQAIAPPDDYRSPTAYDAANYGYMFADDGTPKPEYVFAFDRLGFRVPAVLVSPWLEPGRIEHRRLQHTSVLATVRRMWGLRSEPLTGREARAATFDDLLEVLPEPRPDCPATLTRPSLPDVSLQAALDQPLSPAQKDIFAQVVHLDGHPQSGEEPPMPSTQGEAAAYIAERNDAHRAHHEATVPGGAG